MVSGTATQQLQCLAIGVENRTAQIFGLEHHKRQISNRISRVINSYQGSFRGKDSGLLDSGESVSILETDCREIAEE
ncbi:hypothetical protein FF38_02597 [Lucilia cuprina]|uniref:Uncharacterized protein n=1 Tax=Lucilia cuprina TaxID=7375 RepID=A0A0L0C1Y3_LUCCU|nr:hypothetical protein FF38_02597 [Lucilia cuprina]